MYKALRETPIKPAIQSVSLWSERTKILLSHWNYLVLRDEILYRHFVDPEGVRSYLQLIVPEKYRRDLMERAHGGMTGGHLGYEKTEDQVRRRAYWPTWRSDLQHWMKRCGLCAQYHRGPAPKQACLNPFPSGSPFEVMSMDITGPHPRSSNGNVYILTIIDSFTKWAEAIPIRVHTAQVVAKKLVEVVFTRYGTPLRLLADRGPEFESALISALCKAYDVEKIRTTSYKPTTNGAIERFHRTLNSMLAKVISESQRDWDEFVPEVMAAYRATKHSATGYTPNFLVYGRELRAPIDLVLAVSGEPEGIGSSVDDYVDAMIQRKRRAYDLARRHLGAAAERRKRDYDFHVRSKTFRKGMWVWYFYPRRYRGRSPKWTRQYTGPFLIVDEMPPCNFVLQKSQRSQTFVAHTDKLKMFFGDPPRSWINVEPASEPGDEDRPVLEEVRPSRAGLRTIPKEPRRIREGETALGAGMDHTTHDEDDDATSLPAEQTNEPGAIESEEEGKPDILGTDNSESRRHGGTADDTSTTTNPVPPDAASNSQPKAADDVDGQPEPRYHLRSPGQRKKNPRYHGGCFRNARCFVSRRH